MPIDFKKIDWFSLAFKIPQIVGAAVAIADKFKVPGADKKKAVIEAVSDSTDLIELTVGKDVFHDVNLAALLSAVIDAEAAVLKARKALQAGLLNKAPAVEPTPA